MTHVEYSRQPERYEINRLPHGELLVYLRENIAEAPSEDGERWTADEYAVVIRDRKNLNIAADFESYLAAAKKEEARRKSEAERKQDEAEINAQLIDLLLDYDFRLMMLEENVPF